MKTKFLAVLAAFATFSLTGCGPSTPEDYAKVIIKKGFAVEEECGGSISSSDECKAKAKAIEDEYRPVIEGFSERDRGLFKNYGDYLYSKTRMKEGTDLLDAFTSMVDKSFDQCGADRSAWSSDCQTMMKGLDLGTNGLSKDAKRAGKAYLNYVKLKNTKESN